MEKVYRALYRAQAKAGLESGAATHFTAAVAGLQARLAAGDLLTISLFQWRNQFFAYWETVHSTLSPEELFGPMPEWLESWPGLAQPRTFVPMIDIFHWQAPVDRAHWQRKQPVERPIGRMTRLQPEMASSYIFYHFQLQEEKPGSNDKYGLIAMHENLLFFYQELPAVVEEAPYVGKLSTQNTPGDWHGLMFPHFILWDDAPAGEEIWRHAEVLFHLG
ncbi:MAG: hypothetical protein KF832_29920 [Caldilineaceae bacterium]|nr:hypothetical protein [Caldilineaceae bacterium]